MRASSLPPSLPPSLAHLPNAAHIDWVLQSVKQNPALWNAAWDAARDAARDAAWDDAWDAAGSAARVAAWGAAAALTAWDHAGVALHMPGSDFAGAMALDPHLILLVPASYVLKQEKK